MNKNLHQEYEKDFYAWIMANAALLKQRKFEEIDIENVVEELEDMGGSIKRELINRLALVLAHLLKWQYQPHLRGHSWKYTVKEQRRKIIRLLKENPSLKYQVKNKLEQAYEDAVLMAAGETNLEEEAFSNDCPYTFEQSLDETFYPE